MSTSFAEFLPHRSLLSYIQSYWLGDFNVHGDKEYSQTVMPNGCIELIIHLSADHCFLNKHKEGWLTSPEFTLMGMYERTYEVRFDQPVRVFGIRFHPDGMRNIFGIPSSEFIATHEDGADVLGGKLNDFCARIRKYNAIEQRVKLADEFLFNQLQKHIQTYDYTHQAMRLIRKSGGTEDYRQLTAQVPISLRQLQREFRSWYGITIRDYMRLSRMNAINRYMLTQEGNMTNLSHELNFTDQSHFIREFRQYTGMSPGKFLKNQGHYIINPVVKA